MNEVVLDRSPRSLAGQNATVIHKDGKRDQVTFGMDVELTRLASDSLDISQSYSVEITGHLTDSDFPTVDEAELIVPGDIVFCFRSFGRGLFIAIEPTSPDSQSNSKI